MIELKFDVQVEYFKDGIEIKRSLFELLSDKDAQKISGAISLLINELGFPDNVFIKTPGREISNSNSKCEYCCGFLTDFELKRGLLKHEECF